MRRISITLLGIALFGAAVAFPIVLLLPPLWFAGREIGTAMALAPGTFWRSVVEFLIPAGVTFFAIERALIAARRVLERVDPS